LNSFLLRLSYRISLIFLLSISIALSSGGFDHGTSTGKNKIQIDLTWNPFNYFKYGQSYIVLGFGITDNLDIHSYFSDHGQYHKGVNSYYYGLYYQFLETKYLDLSTAIGKRKMDDLNYYHIFFPQFFYNIKIKKGYTVGGCIVNVKKENNQLTKISNNDWMAFDIAIFIPLTKYFERYTFIEELKFGIGAFTTGLNNNRNIHGPIPTYSIDIKLKKLQFSK